MYRKLLRTHCRKQKAHKNPVSKQTKTKQCAYLAGDELNTCGQFSWNTYMLSNVFFFIFRVSLTQMYTAKLTEL